jgi:hypothetical protein
LRRSDRHDGNSQPGFTQDDGDRGATMDPWRRCAGSWPSSCSYSRAFIIRSLIKSCGQSPCMSLNFSCWLVCAICAWVCARWCHRNARGTQGEIGFV